MLRYWIIGIVLVVICIAVILAFFLHQHSGIVSTTHQNDASDVGAHTIQTSDKIFLSVNEGTSIVQALRDGHMSQFVFQDDGSITINHGFLGLWEYARGHYIARVLIHKTQWNMEKRSGFAVALSTTIDGQTLYLGILKNGDLYFAVGFKNPQPNINDEFYLG